MPSLSPLSVPGGGEGRGEAGEAPLSPAGTPHPPITAQWAPPSPRKRGEGKTAVIAGTTTFIFATGAAGKGDRSIPVEVGVNVVYSGIPFAVMMLTPDDLEDFGVGFSLTEGIVNGAADIRGLRVESDENGLRLMIDLSADRLHAHLARKRAISGRTSCGVCGIDDLEALVQAKSALTAPPTVSLHAIERALTALHGRQELNRLTHAVHAAAWADLNGSLTLIREDVGRHNALDKLIGALLRGEVAPTSGFMVITSRCSFEMVEKTAVFGAGTVVAISAPTSLAVDRARRLGMTLVALARSDTITVFNGAERIAPEEPLGEEKSA